MSEPTCINLAERFGRLYRIGWEADGASKSQWRREDWPWLMEIRCRHGVVHPYGGELLTAFTDKPRIGAKLRQLPFLRHAQGDLEVAVRFHVDDLPAVLAILKPYRRRQYRDRAARQERARAALAKAHAARPIQSDFPAVETTKRAR